MKKYTSVLFSIALILFCTTTIFAQNVCIGINGSVPAVLVTSAKTVKICRINGATADSLYQVNLMMSSCGSSNVSYQWKNITSGTLPLSGATVLTSETGKWVAIVKDNISLIETTDTINVIYQDAITISLTSNEAAFASGNEYRCPLTELTLTAVLSSNLPSSTQITWLRLTPKDTVKKGTGLTYKFTRKNTIYTAYVKDGNGCAASDTSVYFGLDSNFKANLGPDHLFKCEGDKDTLRTFVYTGVQSTNYDTFYGYVDANGNNTNLGVITTSPNINPIPKVDSIFLRDKFAPIPIILAPGTNKYWVRLTSLLSCTGTDTIIIKANPIPVVDLGNDTLLCYGKSLNIKAKILLGTATYHYTWSSSASTANNITVSPITATTYTVSVTDVNNCGTGTDSKLVTVNPPIDVTVSNDATICRYPPGIANLIATASGGTGMLTYNWSPHGPHDGLSDYTILNPTAVPTDYSDFTPSKTVFTFMATDAENCHEEKIVSVNYFVPSLTKIADPIIVSESSPKDLNVSNSENGGYSFSWYTTLSSSVLSSSPILSLSYNGPDTILYIVTTHSNSDGVLNSCMNYDTIEVRYISDNTLLYVPNVFSPNAMNEENKTLKVYGDNLYEEGFKFLIFNKWGNVMYESTNLDDVKSNGWNGGSQIEGVYTYVIVGKFKNGKDVTESPYYKGSFTLMK